VLKKRALVEQKGLGKLSGLDCKKGGSKIVGLSVRFVYNIC
jgi:hypothetical protein